MVVVVVGAYRFYRFDWENDVMLSSFYQALHRQAWSLLICWIIFAGHNGYGGKRFNILLWFNKKIELLVRSHYWCNNSMEMMDMVVNGTGMV